MKTIETFPEEATVFWIWDYAVNAAKAGPEQASEFFKRYVATVMEAGKTREEAVAVVKNNLGYFGGYDSLETRKLIEKTYKCVHPILPPADQPQLTPEEVFALGVNAGQSDTPLQPRNQQPEGEP